MIDGWTFVFIYLSLGVLLSGYLLHMERSWTSFGSFDEETAVFLVAVLFIGSIAWPALLFINLEDR